VAAIKAFKLLDVVRMDTDYGDSSLDQAKGDAS